MVSASKPPAPGLNLHSHYTYEAKLLTPTNDATYVVVP